MNTAKILVMGTSGIMNDGITSWMRQTFGAMDREGFQLVTIAFEGCEPSIVESIEDVGFKVAHVPNRKTAPREYMKSIKALLVKERFNIAHVCCNSALAAYELSAARKANVGMRIAHSRNTMCSHRIVDKIMRPFLYREATDFYACGTDAGKWLFGDRRFTVIPNGKELGHFAFSAGSRDRVRIALGLNNESVVLGHVGRFNDQKNHKKLLEVFTELRERSTAYELVLVGDGGLFEQTKETAQALGVFDHVHFLGRRDDVPQLLNAMDCMVFPSLYEGFPNVVLEWQLNGLPVVMSDAITDECVITPLVSQVSLGASADSWADAVEMALRGHGRTADSRAGLEAAKLGGYDINENAAMLRRLYLRGIVD